MRPEEKYTKMQLDWYNEKAKDWSVDNRDPVVGLYEKHNAHEDYGIYLFKDKETSGKVCLDFGCGPGRNIDQFGDRFERMDGVDICPTLIQKAREWLPPDPKLYVCNGRDLSVIDSDVYDFVMSTICLQHIAVHEIRCHYFEEFLRVLKPGGWICLQMGFGVKPSGHVVSYYDNFYDERN